MKNHKKILNKEFNIDENTKNHNYPYLHRSILKAMDIAAKQALEVGFKNGLYAEIGMEDKLTFEDYLKTLDDETK